MMKKSKKAILSAIAALLCITLAAPTALAQTGDMPELDSVVVYAQEAPPDCKITIGADIWDSDGIMLASLRFTTKDGYSLGVTLENTMGYGTAEERFSGKLVIPPEAPEGEYLLTFASLTDTAANRVRYYASEADMPDSPNTFVLEQRPGFTVKKGAPAPDADTGTRTTYNDSTAPTISGIAVSQTEVVGGVSRYLLQVAATDGGGEYSGISNIIIRLKNDQNGRVLSKVISGDDGADGVYTGWLEVQSYEPSGTFSLYQATVTDRAFNRTGYCRPEDIGGSKKLLLLPATVAVTVDNAGAKLDTTAPTLRAVTVTKPIIAVGDRLQITAEASDDISGIDSVSLQFKSGDGKSVSVLLQQRGGELSGSVTSFQSVQPGSYTLVKATATDNAGNRLSYYATPPKNAAKLTIAAGFKIERN